MKTQSHIRLLAWSLFQRSLGLVASLPIFKRRYYKFHLILLLLQS